MDIVWTHIEQVKDADRNIGWSITRIPNDESQLDGEGNWVYRTSVYL